MNPLVVKLSNVVHLSEEDRQAVERLCNRSIVARSDRDIVSEGDTSTHLNLLMEGWACRYKVLRDGSRQITAFLLPGDFCEPSMAIFGRMDHSVSALTPARVAHIPRSSLDALTSARPNLARALWWSVLVDSSILQGWIVNIGRRQALQRIANLLCELHARLQSIGLVRDGEFDLPLTQLELADSTGLTAVHLNRVLQRLRTEGLITLKDAQLTIHDVDRLKRLCGFDPSYLHPERLKEPDDQRR